MSNVTYSINQYDDEGNQFDTCLLVHHGNVILRFDNIVHLEIFKKELGTCIEQIKEELEQ